MMLLVCVCTSSCLITSLVFESKGYFLALGSGGEESNDTAGQTDAQDVVDVGGGATQNVVYSYSATSFFFHKILSSFSFLLIFLSSASFLFISLVTAASLLTATLCLSKCFVFL